VISTERVKPLLLLLLFSTLHDTERKEIHHKYHKCARALQEPILEHEDNFHLLYFATLFTTAFYSPYGYFKPKISVSK